MIKKRVKAENNSESIKKNPAVKKTDTEKILIENFIAMQKVMTNLALSFDNLSKRISRLLDLFEMSAKTLAEKNYEADKGTKPEKEMNEKLSALLDQNRTIAKGIAMLHENNSDGEYEEPKPAPQQQQMQRRPEDNYQKSISSRP
ncbi:hypothetical protein HY449_03495 [Candidatus Pacearchaeota archaeon]|nr:hypothetical protein [Candidatus Pacearchaeota archaeon]